MKERLVVRKLLIICIIFSLALLIGCSRQDDNDTPVQYNKNSAYVYTDNETGCEYLIYAKGYRGGITARLNQDGKPICR